ncbi:MAG: SixA phosphatase family protein [Bacteroidales bacterium]
MKTLVLMRHSKAESFGYEDDYNRALTERGKDDARYIGMVLVQRNIIPQAILASSALRTRQTAMVVAETLSLDYQKIAKEWDALYECQSSDVFLSEIQSIDEHSDIALVVAHSPLVQYIAQLLCNEKIFDFPTSQTLVVEFEQCKWEDLDYGKGRLVEIINKNK